MAAIPYIAQSLWTLQMIARQAILQNPSISELWAYQLLKKCSTFCPFSKGITSPMRLPANPSLASLLSPSGTLQESHDSGWTGLSLRAASEQGHSAQN